MNIDLREIVFIDDDESALFYDKIILDKLDQLETAEKHEDNEVGRRRAEALRKDLRRLGAKGI